MDLECLFHHRTRYDLTCSYKLPFWLCSCFCHSHVSYWLQFATSYGHPPNIINAPSQYLEAPQMQTSTPAGGQPWSTSETQNAPVGTPLVHAPQQPSGIVPVSIFSISFYSFANICRPTLLLLFCVLHGFFLLISFSPPENSDFRRTAWHRWDDGLFWLARTYCYRWEKVCVS